MIAFIIKLNLYVLAQNCNSLSPLNFTFLVLSNSNTLVVEPGMSNEKNAVNLMTIPTWTAKIPGATWIWDNVTRVNTGKL